VGATPRLKQIAADLVAHFEARTEATAGKGMIVTMSREICVHFTMRLLPYVQIGMTLILKKAKSKL
jgi:type I site-specific restriction-modification system R (restriction) subunit